MGHRGGSFHTSAHATRGRSIDCALTLSVGRSRPPLQTPRTEPFVTYSCLTTRLLKRALGWVAAGEADGVSPMAIQMPPVTIVLSEAVTTVSPLIRPVMVV